MRQIDLEKHFTLTNPTVTGILNTMEKKYLIKRTANKQDNRSKLIVSTEEAYRRKDEMTNLYETIEDTLAQDLDAVERKNLKNLLSKLIAENA